MASPSVSCRRHLRRPVPAWKSATLPSTLWRRPSLHCPTCVRHIHFIQVPYRLTAGFPAPGDSGDRMERGVPIRRSGVRFESRRHRGAASGRRAGIDRSGNNGKGRQAAVPVSHRRIADGGLSLRAGDAVIGRNWRPMRLRWPWQRNPGRGHTSGCSAPRCG